MAPTPMTYLQFHFVFTIPAIALLAWFQPKPIAGVGGKLPTRWLFGLATIAFLYTTPWDNFLVYDHIWGYGDERVLFTIGYVPFEEYLFFLLQPFLTGLFFYRMQARYVASEAPKPAHIKDPFVRALGVMFWLQMAALGWFCLQTQPGRYMGLILVWAPPVLAGQWYLSGNYFWRYRKLWFTSIMLPTIYLWFADRIAIALGIWYITDETRTGFDPLGLPIEEAVFFLVTNILVVQGLMMFVPMKGERSVPLLQREEQTA